MSFLMNMENLIFLFKHFLFFITSYLNSMEQVGQSFPHLVEDLLDVSEIRLCKLSCWRDRDADSLAKIFLLFFQPKD